MKKIKKFLKVLFILTFTVVLCGSFSSKVQAKPAPSLTSLEIIDLSLDDNNEIHVVVKELGTSKSGLRFVTCNGNSCRENINESQILWGPDNIGIGYIRYFHTGIHYSSSKRGTSLDTTATFTNEMSPWNTLSTSRTFVLP